MIDPTARPSTIGRRTVLRSMLLAAAALPLAACSASEDPLAEQARSGDNKNYIAGDGSVEEYAIDKRTDPIELSAETYQGTKVDFSEWAGTPIVMNFWYASCAPCRIEAPHLRALHDEFEGKAHFLGVNVRDEKPAAEAFERSFKIPYESVNDIDGDIQLSMTQYVPLQAVPTTLVIDKQGRVAARVLGAVEEGTLRSLIKTVISEEA